MKWITRIILLLFLAGVGAIVYREYYARTAAKAPLVAPTVAPSPPAPAGPRYPVPEQTAAGEESATAGATSSGKAAKRRASSVEEALRQLVGKKAFRRFLEEDGMALRIVMAVANEDAKQIPADHMPWKRVAGDLRVDHKPESVSLSPENARRYQPLLDLLDRVSSKDLVSVYTMFYPSFQEAYEQTGNKGYFNDRLIEAIDDALKAPEPTPPLALEEGTVNYKFQDQELESLDAGQKVLVRMGPENSRRVKAKLRELRALLTQLDQS